MHTKRSGAAAPLMWPIPSAEKGLDADCDEAIWQAPNRYSGGPEQHYVQVCREGRAQLRPQPHARGSHGAEVTRARNLDI